MAEEPKPESAQAPTSPLAEADAQSLEVLFSRDPFEMIVEDEQWTEGPEGWKHKDGRTSKTSPRNFDTIVAALRRQREAWKKAEANGATRGVAGPKVTKPKSTTTLADLGLE